MIKKIFKLTAIIVFVFLISISYGDLSFKTKIRGIGILDDGKVVVGCEKRIYIINGSNIIDNYSRNCNILKCSKYDIIFGYGNSLFQIKKEGGAWITYSDNLDSNIIDIDIDSPNYAASTLNKVYLYRTTSGNIGTYKVDGNVIDISVNREYTAVGTTNGVYLLFRKGKLWSKKTNNWVKAVYVDKDGNVFAGCTNGELLAIDKKGNELWEKTLDGYIIQIVRHNGKIIVAYKKGLAIFDEYGNLLNKIPENPPKYIFVANNKILIGTSSSTEIYTLDGKPYWVDSYPSNFGVIVGNNTYYAKDYTLKIKDISKSNIENISYLILQYQKRLVKLDERVNADEELINELKLYYLRDDLKSIKNKIEKADNILNNAKNLKDNGKLYEVRAKLKKCNSIMDDIDNSLYKIEYHINQNLYKINNTIGKYENITKLPYINEINSSIINNYMNNIVIARKSLNRGDFRMLNKVLYNLSITYNKIKQYPHYKSKINYMNNEIEKYEREYGVNLSIPKIYLKKANIQLRNLAYKGVEYYLNLSNSTLQNLSKTAIKAKNNIKKAEVKYNTLKSLWIVRIFGSKSDKDLPFGIYKIKKYIDYSKEAFNSKNYKKSIELSNKAISLAEEKSQLINHIGYIIFMFVGLLLMVGIFGISKIKKIS